MERWHTISRRGYTLYTGINDQKGRSFITHGGTVINSGRTSYIKETWNKLFEDLDRNFKNYNDSL